MSAGNVTYSYAKSKVESIKNKNVNKKILQILITSDHHFGSFLLQKRIKILLDKKEALKFAKYASAATNECVVLLFSTNLVLLASYSELFFSTKNFELDLKRK